MLISDHQPNPWAVKRFSSRFRYARCLGCDRLLSEQRDPSDGRIVAKWRHCNYLDLNDIPHLVSPDVIGDTQ